MGEPRVPASHVRKFFHVSSELVDRNTPTTDLVGLLTSAALRLAQKEHTQGTPAFAARHDVSMRRCVGIFWT